MNSRSNSVSSLNNNINNNKTTTNNILYDNNYDLIKNEFYKLSNNILNIYDSLNNYCDSIKLIYIGQNSYLNNSFSYYDSNHPISKYGNEILTQIDLVFNEWGLNQAANFQALVEFCNQLDAIRIKIESYESGNKSDSNLKSEVFNDVIHQFDCRVNNFDIPLINIQFSLNSLITSISTIQNNSSSSLQNKINFINPVSHLSQINTNTQQLNGKINNSSNNNMNKPINNSSNNIINSSNNSLNKPPLPTASNIKKASLKPLARPSSVEIPKIDAPDNMYRSENKEKHILGQHITPPARAIPLTPQQHTTPAPRLDILKQQTKPAAATIQPIKPAATPPLSRPSDDIVPNRPAPIPQQTNHNLVSRPRAQSVNYSSPPLQRPPVSPIQTRPSPVPLFPKPAPQPLLQKPAPQPLHQKPVTQLAPQQQPLRPTPTFPKPLASPSQQNNLNSQPPEQSIHQPLRPAQSFPKPLATAQQNNIATEPQSRPLASSSRSQANSYQQQNKSANASTPAPYQNNNYINNFNSNSFNYQRPLPQPQPKFQPYPSIEENKQMISSKPTSSSSSSSKKGFSFSKLVKEIEDGVNSSNGGFGMAVMGGGPSCGLTGRPISNDPNIQDLMYDYEKHRKIFGNKRFKLSYSYTQTVSYKKFNNKYTILKGKPVSGSSVYLYIFEPLTFQSQNITSSNIVFRDSNGFVAEPTVISHFQNILSVEFKTPKEGQTFYCDYEFTADLYSATLVEAAPNEQIQVEPISNSEREFFLKVEGQLKFNTPEFEQFINDNLLYPQQYSDGTLESKLCFSYRVSLYIKCYVKYDLSSGNQEPLETIRKGLGNCSSYSILFASILRYNDIPCRIISGLVSRKKETLLIGGRAAHGQNEFYIEEIGWVPYNGAFMDHGAYNFLAFGRSLGDLLTLGMLQEKGILPTDPNNERDFQMLHIQPPASYEGTKITSADFITDDQLQKIDNYSFLLT
ncbi:hypothetical protein DICPUDRAFT_152350 [Dictyostelium purpureum]|uniref:Transglutaminase-like domain-containing protein n=1 Tax=Dictyostelium purpureum TaxID=5786 RepID=F0ZL49_DICPU|nr:uncharacterized protein DICPUDRAFT_152350 [Dictyostelium purpureum]EGC35344.1 hypothetical protein DICPUDRAFT_152350 [Dictyostelium purpureum]|eukprot:XP_003288151.1 hypothetical protein DICPUDRAFT_152350 [Dictyostelium purpureum]